MTSVTFQIGFKKPTQTHAYAFIHFNGPAEANATYLIKAPLVWAVLNTIQIYLDTNELVTS